MNALEELLSELKGVCAGLEDKRQGPGYRHTMADIGLAAFSVFFMQCPSFLDHQRQLQENPGVDAAIKTGQYQSAAQHFVLNGMREGRGPSAFFSTSWYLAHNADVAKAVQASQTTAHEHYSQFGWKEGRDASVWFDTSEYLTHNADVAAAGVNPLTHLLDFGMREGRLAYANDAGLWG